MIGLTAQSRSPARADFDRRGLVASQDDGRSGPSQIVVGGGRADCPVTLLRACYYGRAQGRPMDDSRHGGLKSSRPRRELCPRAGREASIRVLALSDE